MLKSVEIPVRKNAFSISIPSEMLDREGGKKIFATQLRDAPWITQELEDRVLDWAKKQFMGAVIAGPPGSSVPLTVDLGIALWVLSTVADEADNEGRRWCDVVDDVSVRRREEADFFEARGGRDGVEDLVQAAIVKIQDLRASLASLE